MKKFFDLQRFAKVVKLTNKADYYENEADNVKILALGGDDTIKGYSFNKNFTIDGGKGNDSINSSGSNVSINGGAGNDEIYDFGYDNVIVGGTGNDSITGGDYSTITGGKGADTINAYAEYNQVIKYSSGDGNDIIEGFNSSDTLYIAKGSYSTMIGGDYNEDFIVTVGKQKITLKYAVLYEYDKVIIKDSSGNVAVYNDWKIMKGTSGNDFLDNEANNVTVDGGKGNDYIINDGSYVTVLGGAGNDTVNSFGRNENISGGAGNDSIYSGGDNSTVLGGAGKDSIDCLGDNTVVIGGKGNDAIDLRYYGSFTVNYASGDGKDTVKSFDSDDVLHITKGSYSVSTNGDDVVVKVGKGSITLKDAAGQEISIKNSKGKVTTKTYSVSSALFAENNFVTADNLSEIIAEKYVGEFEFNSPEKLTQENLIAYAAK